jgi:hypothetical protein
LGAEIEHLAGRVEAPLALSDLGFEDIEGHLVYVRLLVLIAREHKPGGLDPARVLRWKRAYLDAFDAAPPEGQGDYVPARREVMAVEFDALLSKLGETS